MKYSIELEEERKRQNRRGNPIDRKAYKRAHKNLFITQWFSPSSQCASKMR